MTADAARSTVVARIEAVASEAPDRLAVHAADGTLTYGELLERAGVLAGELRRVGVGTDDLVGLCVERSATLVVGGLGILQAGAAYVAIDPKYPAERIGWMLEDSGALATVCDDPLAVWRGDRRPTFVLGGGGVLDAESAPPDGADSRGAPGPRDLAYVVYTSGSTGLPKGVLVEHASLSNLIDWHREAFSVGASDRCTQIASPGFDAAVWEVWPTLAAGASLHVVPDDRRGDPLGLRDWLVAKRITVAFLPTAVAEGVVRVSWPATTSLRFLLTGGDALTVRPPRDLPFTLVNNYGLSETAVVATSGAVDPEGVGPPTIGAAITAVDAQVVDEDLAPVAPGEAGELLIGGVAVARGYLNRPDLTKERFVAEGGRRRYRTGDRVRQRPDGEYEFLGRLDDQLSIRGFRVEPGEIAAALLAHPTIAGCVVVGAGHSSAERQLVAYVVADSDARPERDELAEFLRGSLPEYLVPARFIWLDELPLTAHGKVDRDALPAPFETDEGEGRASGRPRTETEDKIAAVLTELLDVPDVGVDENFFLLGGHSMLGAQLIVRLENLFDVELTLRYLFDHPTLGEIAAGVERQLAGEDP